MTSIMTPYRSLLNLFIVGLIILTFASCNLNDDPPEVAEAHVEFQLLDEATGEPITDVRVQLGTSYVGEETIINRGIAQTNEEGRITGIMTANDEVTIDRFYLFVEIEQDFIVEVEVDADLPLRFEEPFESEEHVVSVDTTDDDEEESGSDEEGGNEEGTEG